jgi:hypothetical protein
MSQRNDLIATALHRAAVCTAIVTSDAQASRQGLQISLESIARDLTEVRQRRKFESSSVAISRHPPRRSQAHVNRFIAPL